jgi:hypothetical protein
MKHLIIFLLTFSFSFSYDLVSSFSDNMQCTVKSITVNGGGNSTNSTACLPFSILSNEGRTAQYTNTKSIYNTDQYGRCYWSSNVVTEYTCKTKTPDQPKCLAVNVSISGDIYSINADCTTNLVLNSSSLNPDNTIVCKTGYTNLNGQCVEGSATCQDGGPAIFKQNGNSPFYLCDRACEDVGYITTGSSCKKKEYSTECSDAAASCMETCNNDVLNFSCDDSTGNINVPCECKVKFDSICDTKAQACYDSCGSRGVKSFSCDNFTGEETSPCECNDIEIINPDNNDSSSGGGTSPTTGDTGNNSGAGINTGTDTGTGTGNGTDTGTGPDSGTGTDTDSGNGTGTGTGTGIDTGIDTGIGTGTGTGINIGTGTGTDSGNGSGTGDGYTLLTDGDLAPIDYPDNDNPLSGVEGAYEELVDQYYEFYDNLKEKYDSLTSKYEEVKTIAEEGFEFKLTSSDVANCPVDYTLDLSSLNMNSFPISIDICQHSSQIRPFIEPVFTILIMVTITIFAFSILGVLFV